MGLPFNDLLLLPAISLVCYTDFMLSSLVLGWVSDSSPHGVIKGM